MDVPETKPTITPDKITTGSPDSDFISQPEDMTGDSKEETLLLEKKVNVKKLQNKKKISYTFRGGKLICLKKLFTKCKLAQKEISKEQRIFTLQNQLIAIRERKKGKNIM